MNKKLPIYILIIYFIFVILILALQLAGRSKREFVAVGFNDRLDNAVVVYEKSPIMLKKQAQVFINDENRSETPIVIDNVTYLPMSFYKNGFDAIISYSKNKDQITLKYDKEQHGGLSFGRRKRQKDRTSVCACGDRGGLFSACEDFCKGV